MSTLRNAQLLKQMESNPLRSSLAKILDVAEEFQSPIEFVSGNRDLSAEGRQKAAQGLLRKAVRDLRDARGPLNDLQAKVETRKKAVTMLVFDENNAVAFLRRQELRQTLKGMDPGKRATYLIGPKSKPAYTDAMLELEPEASGLLPAEDSIVETAKKERLESLFAPQLAEIAELERTVAEAKAIVDVARVDLQSRSGMEWDAFEKFVKPVENRQAAPWLLRQGDRVVVVEPGATTYLDATPDQLRDGKYYADMQAYQRDRAA